MIHYIQEKPQECAAFRNSFQQRCAGRDINLKHLEYFIKVARLGSINKAAQMLYVSQSHLGKIIHDLEETVGAPLLNRSRQGVTLTPEGNEFLERSVRILK